MYRNKQNFNFHNLMVRAFFSILVLSFAVLSCRQSEPNPIHGAWLPDSNIHSRIVFNEKMYIYGRGKVTQYNYRIDDSGRKLITQDSAGKKRAYSIYFFENELTVRQNRKNEVIFTKAK